MKKIELSIKSPYATTILKEDRKPTVFKRATRVLWEKGLYPGFIVPIYVKLNGEFKVFGVLTLNSGGSVSFFPDWYKLDFFDHLTLSADFIGKKGHLTEVGTGGKHRKVLHLEASKLDGNFDYNHLLTYVMKDSDRLMDSPPEITFTEILYEDEDEKEKYYGWIEKAISHGHCVLSFPEEGTASYCIQILVYPKGIDNPRLAVNRDPIEKLLLEPRSLEGETISAIQAEIPTPDNCDFSICVLTFNSNYPLQDYAFMMAQDPEKQKKIGF